MIYSADLLVPVTSEVIKNGAVRVQNGLITTFGTREQIVEQYCSDEERHFDNALIMPGLVNLHGHLECAAFEDLAKPSNFADWLGEIISAGSRFHREDWLAASRIGVKRYLQAGITCTADITRSGTGMQALMEAGMPSVVYIEAVAIDKKNIAWSVIDILEKVKSARTLVDNGCINVGLSPHSPYTLSAQALKVCSQIATEYELPITIHVAETKDESDLIERGDGLLAERIGSRLEIEAIENKGTGKTVVEFLDDQGLLTINTIAAHGVWLNDKDIQRLKERNIIIALCPTSNEILNSGAAPVEKFVEAGLRYGFGTDSAASNPEMDLFSEAKKFLSMLGRAYNMQAQEQTGVHDRRQNRERDQVNDPKKDSDPIAGDKVDAKTIVEKLTIEAATMLALDDKVGSVAEGKRADLIVIDCNDLNCDPYEYLINNANKSSIRNTVLGGAVVFERE